MRVSTPFPRTHGRTNAKRGKLSGKLWLLLPIVLLVIAALVFWRLRATTTAPATTTATVSQGDIAVTISGSGTVAAARSVDLTFEQAGTITTVAVKVGDQVTSGQALAQISASELELQLQQAQANLKSAQAAFAQTQNGSATEDELASAQAQLNSANAQLAQTKTGTTTAADLASAQAQLESAQAQLDALINPSQVDLNTAQTAVAQALTSLETQRNSLSQAKSNAYNQMQQAVNSLTQAQAQYTTAKHNWEYVQETGKDPIQPSTTGSDGTSKANTLSGGQAQQYADAFVQAEAALKNAENSVQQAQVAYDVARANEAAQIPLLEQAVSNTQAQLDALKNPSVSSLKQAQAAVTQAKANLTKLQQGGTAAEIAQSQASVVQAQSNLAALTAPPTEVELISAEASVLQAQVAVATAQDNLDKATLKAPFDGVVTAVSAAEGTPSSTTAAAVSIADTSTLHVDLSLSEADAAKVKVGQPVTLTFDALRDVTIQGSVATISPAATTEQNVVTYPVTVEFDPGEAAIKVGMSVSADIQTEQATDAVLVPTRAVQTSGTTKTVTVLQGTNQTPVTVEVTTGLASDGQTQITGCADGTMCLRAGDVLAVASTNTTTTSTQRQNTSSFGGTFGGAPPAGAGRP